MFELKKLLKSNSYPGRGIVAGLSADGKKALWAYFIMGRSVNSRNRVFEPFEGGMRTRAFDESLVSDPSLIIYNAYLSLPGFEIVTNGDQTDTVFDALKASKSFENALRTRAFEPDAPNFTPRISALLSLEGGFSYKMAILKASDASGSGCDRFFFEYSPVAGLGHFLHTYVTDGDPIPSFFGEPEPVFMPDGAEELCETIWQSLDSDNKVSLMTKEISLENGETKQFVVNKNRR